MDNSFIVLYHGGITSERGIETLINLLKINPNINGIILGNGDKQYINELFQLITELQVENRIIFHEAVPIEELYKYVGCVDLSLMMIKGKSRSYYLSLPNKFFESIQALTPIVASDFPEMKRLIDKYEIGLTCDQNDLNAINMCVERMRTDTAFYNKCKRNLKRAKEDLSWENEKSVLINAFQQKIMGVSV